MSEHDRRWQRQVVVADGEIRMVRIEADPMWLVAGRTVTGIMVGDHVPELFIPHLLQLEAEGRFRFEWIVSRCGGLEAINDAVDAIDRGDVVKAVLTIHARAPS